MAELQPRIDEIEASLAEVKGENEKHRGNLTRLQQEQEAQKERALSLRNGKLEVESEKATLTTHLAKVPPTRSLTLPAHLHAHAHPSAITLTPAAVGTPPPPATPAAGHDVGASGAARRVAAGAW
jgi:hypothetical protein